MLNKFIFLLIFLLSFNLHALEESVEISVARQEVAAIDPGQKILIMDLYTLAGYQQAIEKELQSKSLDSSKFWAKIDERKLTQIQKIELFKPLFINTSILISPPTPEVPAESSDLKALFKFEVNQEKIKLFFEEILSDLPDISLKTFYLLVDIGIDKDLNWNDLGVSKKENFSGVIVDSWKKWAATHFKNFTNVVVLEKDFSDKKESMNSESVTLKWNSMLKRTEIFQDRKAARFELTAQFVLVNTKSNISLLAFDFPKQKREFGVTNPKELSSQLASLTYNLLNSQTAKISSTIESNQSSGNFYLVDIPVKGKHGLFDITGVNSFLMSHFKSQQLEATLKSHSSDASVISIKSSIPADTLYALLAKEGGRFSFNEQKILLFSSEDRSFAIIAKEANN